MLHRSKDKVVCKNCSKFFFPCYSSFKIYCSNICQKDFQTKEEIKKWLSGKDNPINTNGLLRPWARQYLFKLFNNKCVLCGWGEINKTTGKTPLEVDHLDGNFKNNEITNLRLLCPNCHSLTSNYKSLNKGNGRSKRKKLR